MSFSISYGTGCILQTKLQERAEVLLEVRNVQRQKYKKTLDYLATTAKSASPTVNLYSLSLSVQKKFPGFVLQLPYKCELKL